MAYNKSTNKKPVSAHAIDSERFWGKTVKSEGCWEWAGGRNTTGYGVFHVKSLPDDYERTGRTMTQLVAHRVAYYLTYGEIAPDKYVMHKCDNTRCVRPDHLMVGTAQDNVNDMIAKGRHNFNGRNRR